MAQAKKAQIDNLIDRFVETINRLPRESECAEDLPASVRGDATGPEEEEPLWYDWHIRPWANIDWIEPVEQRLGLVLPPSYRALVTRYVFPAFETGLIQLSGNTPEGVYFEFRERVFQDPAFAELLLPAGYIAFGNPYFYNYDPVCFDTRRTGADGECPIVWIDHEEILCNSRICVLKQVSPSFAAFARDFVHVHSTQE